MKLTSADCLITLLYYAFVLSVALGFRSRIKTSAEFFHAGRSLPTWLCTIALLAAGLGLPEVLGLAAAGARFGLAALPVYALAAIPALVFAGIFLVPVLYGSGARSIPGYLRLRFGHKTGWLSAALFIVFVLFSAAVSLSLIARILRALHVFDFTFRAMGWPLQAVFVVSTAVPALVVLVSVVFGGLRGAVYNQALQLLVLIAGFLPAVFFGLSKIGGWSGLMASLPVALSAPEAPHAVAGTGTLAAGLALALIFGFSFWCTDTRAMQFVLAAKNAASARRVPLIGAVLALVLPLLFVVAGLVAIALPTPHTTSVARYENGIIYHETTVVRPEVEAGNGLVPARVDSATGKMALNSAGHPTLDYEMAAPNLLATLSGENFLGLGLTALLASLMCGITAGVTALNTVFVRDLYQTCLRKDSNDAHYLSAGRWTTFAAVLLTTALALAFRNYGLIDLLLPAFVTVVVPLFVAVLLGVFWKRATSHGAFAGLIAGTATALAYYVLASSTGAHHCPDPLMRSAGTSLAALLASVLIAVAVSLLTPSRPEQAGGN